MGKLGNFLIVRPVFFYLWTVSLCILGKPWRFGRVLRDIFLIDLERNREPSLNESRQSLDVFPRDAGSIVKHCFPMVNLSVFDRRSEILMVQLMFDTIL